MKIIAYGIRDDEMPYVDEWKQAHSDVEVKVVQELLTMDTVDQCKGFDGLVSYQQKPYTAELIDAMGANGIKFWSLRNVGIDNIDFDAVKRNNIVLTNVPGYSPEAIAEFSVTQTLRLLRNTKQYEAKMRNGNFMWAPEIAGELNEKTVGVVATGRIGRFAIQYFQGFGCKVIAYDLFHNPDIEKQGLYVDTLDELFAQADVIDLHAPATKDNYHMINADSIAKMKDGAIIINTARGELVDTETLLKAVHDGKLSGAALDTYEDEVGKFNNDFGSFDAIPDDVLKGMVEDGRILVSPHIAFYTTTAVRNMVQIALNNNKQLIESNGAKADFIVKY